MSKTTALKSSGSTVVGTPALAIVPETKPKPAVQASRVGMKLITMHQPEDVHRQLKMLAAEQGRKLEDLQAEAFNLLFAKYRKPEIAISSQARSAG